MNLYNTQRDNTMSFKDFQDCISKQLKITEIPFLGLKLLEQRYKVKNNLGEERISFKLLHRDLELCEAGIQPDMLWAVEFAEDFVKSIIVGGHRDAQTFLLNHSRTRNSLIEAEFMQACMALNIMPGSKEDHVSNFFQLAAGKVP